MAQKSKKKFHMKDLTDMCIITYISNNFTRNISSHDDDETKHAYT